MAEYRLYSLDESRWLMRSDDFVACSDADAIRIARSMRKAGNCQLWSLDRYIATIRPRRSRARQ